MNAIYSLSQMIHIFAGACALVLFWLPTLIKKGSPRHIRAGRYYVNVMYTVAASGFIMAILGLIDPLGLHGDKVVAGGDIEQQILIIRSLRLFLLYLCLLTLTTIRHGVLVLHYKADRQQLKKPTHLILTTSLTALGPVLAIWGYNHHLTLLVIFGILGTLTGSGMLRYSFKATITKMQWWLEHLGSMIASGIAAYTAFFAFGGRHIFEGHGNLQLASWILPGIIGSIAISYLSRFYRNKFAGV
jgi:hypothetical protein